MVGPSDSSKQRNTAVHGKMQDVNVSALLNSSVTSSSGTKVSARFEAMDLSSADRHGKCPWSPAYAVMALFLLNHLHQRVV